MGNSNLKAEDVLIEAGLPEYKTGIDFFYSELVELKVILYLAEKIIDFPFELFTSPEGTIFFSTVMRGFHDSAILIITRLATDQKGDLYTLPRFKNSVRNLIKPEFKSMFDQRLKESRFDQQIDALLEKAKELRRNRIAHTTQDLISGGIQVSRPTLSELKTLSEALNSLLGTLSFNVEQMMLPLAYDSTVVRPAGHEQKTDIEGILDCIARNSRLLNLPESNPGRWHHQRERMSEEQRSQLNYYRRKFGLPEV